MPFEAVGRKGPPSATATDDEPRVPVTTKPILPEDTSAYLLWNPRLLPAYQVQSQVNGGANIVAELKSFCVCLMFSSLRSGIPLGSRFARSRFILSSVFFASGFVSSSLVRKRLVTSRRGHSSFQ